MANAVFSCPKCGQALGELPATGAVTATCVTCRFSYEVIRGKVSGYAGQYEYRVDLPEGRTETVSFVAPQGAPELLARPGDVISAVYLRRGNKREQLLSVRNATTGGQIVVSFTGDRAAGNAWRVALTAAAVVFFVMVVLDQAALPSMAATLAVLAGGRLALGRLFLPRTKVSTGDATRLSGMQRLLAEKQELETARTRTERELESRRTFRDRLSALRAKMVHVGLDAYQARIAVIDRALALVDSQFALQERLRDGYERSIQMLEIELEAGVAADVLGNTDPSHLEATLAEIRELETQQAELTRQLSANAEVEALLKSS